MRGDGIERGSRGELEINGGEGEEGVGSDGGDVRVEGRQGPCDSDIDAIRGDADATAKGERGAKPVEVINHTRRLCDDHELIVEQHAPVVVMEVGVRQGHVKSERGKARKT